MKKTFLLLLNCFLLCLNANASEKVAHSPKVNMWVTDSGMKVAYVHVPNMIINLELAFHAGSSRDGANYGLASLTNNLVSAGGEKLSFDEIASQFDNSGVIFSYNSGKDSATLSLQSLSSKEFFEPAISTFTDMIKAPNFSDNDFTRIRSHALQEIKFKDQSPISVAYKNFFSAMYHDHPYSHPSYGTEETVKLISQDMVKSFYNKHYCKENAVLAIVGDITEKEAHVLANRISSSLPSGSTLPSLEVIKEISSADVKVTYPSSQSTLVLGGLGVTPHSKDIFALDLASSILGGGLDSRLSIDIREKRGLV